MVDLNTELGLIAESEYLKFRGISPLTARNERCQGKGPQYVKLGNKILYKLASVREFVAARTVTPGKAPTLATGTPRRKRA